MWGLLFIHDIKISKALFYATLNFSSICCYQIFKSWSSIHSIVLFSFFFYQPHNFTTIHYFLLLV